jgi:hypothetical protein
MTLIDSAETAFEAAVLIVAIEYELMTGTLRDVLRTSENNAGQATRSVEETDLVCARMGRVVRRVYRALPIWNTCLRRSLVLHRMLRKRGIEADFRMGVGKVGDKLFGHAWVEYHGNPVLDRNEAAKFRAFPSSVAPSRTGS